MENLIVVLALIVAGEYLVIAVVVVPKLARIARTDRRIVILAQWGAMAFFLGCAITHTMISLQTIDPGLVGSMDMAPVGGTQALLWEMVVPHIAQVVGGAIFIVIATRRLEVSITSKVQAEELRLLNGQLRSAFDRAQLGFSLTVARGRTNESVYVNPAYLQIFGLDPDGPLPNRQDLLDRVHPDDRPASALTASNDVCAGVVDHEFRVVHPDGAVRWVHSRLSPAGEDRDGAERLTVVVEDVTDRVTAHVALEQSEQRFTQLANSVTVGISLRQLDPPKLMWVNAAYARLVLGDDATPEDPRFGLQDPAIFEDPSHLLLHPEDRDRVLTQYWPRAQAGEVVESEHRVLRPDGQVRWVHVTSNPVLDDDGGVTRVAGTVEDITVRRNAAEAMRTAQAAAERANNARDEFLSRASHELRTPLNAVLGFGQLLELDELLPDQQQAVSHILRSGRHLLALINDVLDVSQLEAGHEIGLEPVAVTELVGDVIRIMGPTATANGITLRRADGVDPEIPDLALACPRRLKQVLLNLLSNAIKYNTALGSVQVSTVATANGRVQISVTDTGVGIRATDLPRLLVPFDRLGQESTTIEGAGMGLAVTDRLIHAMGGELLVESIFGTGSTFSVSLPAVTGGAGPSRTAHPGDGRIGAPALATTTAGATAP